MPRKEFLDNLKAQLNYNEIFVRTPKGDIKRLTGRSTPLDFAYSVHSDIGDHFRGCLVNGVMVSMDYVLQTGDIVQILTAKNNYPREGWLKIARSPRTRSKIRRWIKAHALSSSTSSKAGVYKNIAARKPKKRI